MVIDNIDFLGIEGEIADAQARQDVGDLKSALQAMSTATSEDEGKALKAKTVTNGKVIEWEFGEVGGADPAVIEQAVDDWLDENPQATTTVQDGSLTEAKFTSGTLLALKNYYVTPEMFGAVGDGTTDDTQAIQNMFDSNNFVFTFSNKSYMIDDSIVINKDCFVYFNKTTIIAKKVHNVVRAFEYMIGVIDSKVTTFGKLYINANNSVNIGLFIENAGGSKFDFVQVNYARIWGVYTSRAKAGNNGLHFESLAVGSNGNRVHAKAKYVDTKHLKITNISCPALANYTRDALNSLFDNRYKNCRYVIDDSGFVLYDLFNRYVMPSLANEQALVLDENSSTDGVFTIAGTTFTLPAAYVDGDNGRDVLIPIGGGVCFDAGTSEGAFSIGSLTSMSQPIGFLNCLSYGGTIREFSSEYDTVSIATDITYALNIIYMYMEAIGTGYNYHFNNQFDRIMLIAQNSSTYVTVDNPFVGTERVAFYQPNEVILQNQRSDPSQHTDCVLNCNNYLVSRKLNAPTFVSASIKIAINEYSPTEIVISNTNLPTGNTIELNLLDIWAHKKNTFSPVSCYFKLKTGSGNKICKIGMTSDLINAGYTINGAVDNVLQIDGAEYNDNFKVTIILYGKVFYVLAEALTGWVTNAT